MFICDVCRFACVLNEPFTWNFPHVQNLGHDLTSRLRSLTSANVSLKTVVTNNSKCILKSRKLTEI